jgi:hypothetical protein
MLQNLWWAAGNNIAAIAGWIASAGKAAIGIGVVDNWTTPDGAYLY